MSEKLLEYGNTFVFDSHVAKKDFERLKLINYFRPSKFEVANK